MKRFLTGLVVLMGIVVSAGAQNARIAGGELSCLNGKADLYSCSNVNLLSFMPISDIGGGIFSSLNDIWGWEDPETGHEYALVGRNDGTAFVDVTDPINPVFVGQLPLHAGATASSWRDIKVYKDHAYVVADLAGLHGMQIFNLNLLRSATVFPTTFSESAHYDGFGSAHNIVINEETGFAYAVGISFSGQTCGGGLHMIDIQNPEAPVFAGCFSDTGTGRIGTGYTHDAQCVVYHGPDSAFQGREICFGANETAISIADVTDKSNPVAVSSASYPNVGYVHQGWLTEDHRYFFQDDELDEYFGLVPQTKTLIWDVSVLNDPQLMTEYNAPTTTIDHNLYISGDLVYQSNYTSGLRILNISDVSNPLEVGFFDTTPDDEAAVFAGTWSVYPYFKSGTLVLSSIEDGLFVVKPSGMFTAGEVLETSDEVALGAPFPNPFSDRTTLSVATATTQRVSVVVYDMLGREIERLYDGTMQGGKAVELHFDGSGLPGGTYVFRATGETFRASRLVSRVK